MEKSVVFHILREPAYNGMGIPCRLYINGAFVGSVKNGGTLTAEGPATGLYLIEKDGPFGPAALLRRGRGVECGLRLRTTGGYGAPNGQDRIVCHRFWLGELELKEPSVYEKLRAARRQKELRASLTEWEWPLFVCYAFWQAFGKALEREKSVRLGEGMAGAMAALEQVGAGETAAFCRDLMGPELAPGDYPLPDRRPDFRRDLTGAVHRYILKNDGGTNKDPGT